MKKQSRFPLQKELDYFTHNKDEFLKHYKGQFVLIKGNTLIGGYTTEQEAYQAGVSRYGSETFFIKQVLEDEPIFAHPALTAGLTYARS